MMIADRKWVLVSIGFVLFLAMGCAPDQSEDLVATSSSPQQTATILPSPTVAATPTPPAVEIVEVGGIEAYAYQPVSQVVPGRLRPLYAGPDGGVWIVSDEAAAHWQDGRVAQTVPALPGSFVGVDLAGNVWAATESDIQAWNGSEWMIYGPESGWTQPPGNPAYVYRSVTDAQGRFWVPTSADVRLFDGEQWTIFTPEDMGLENILADTLWFAFTLLPASSGDLWLGVCHVVPQGGVGGQGVRVFRDSVWVSEDGLPADGCVSALSGDPEGTLWLNASAEVWHRADPAGDWEQFAPPPLEQGRYGDDVQITVDPTGGAWVLLLACGGAGCFNSMLYHLAGTEWTPVAGWDPGLLYPEGLYLDAAGDLWAGNIQLLQVTGEPPAVAGQRAVLRIAQAVDGRIWFIAEDADGEPRLFSPDSD